MPAGRASDPVGAPRAGRRGQGGTNDARGIDDDARQRQRDASAAAALRILLAMVESPFPCEKKRRFITRVGRRVDML